MKHFEFSPSPVESLPYFSRKLEVELLVKRDDLAFPELGGGSKARMLQYLLYDLHDYEMLVTAGGPCSNFNRSCAMMCARLKKKFHLIEYTDRPEEFKTSVNYKLCKMAGMTTTRCEKSNVVQCINEVVNELKKTGVDFKLVYGGGKSLEGIYSYYDAVSELASQIDGVDHLFVACGTGTTLTGICAGMQKHFPQAKVHAISVARSYENEYPVLLDDMRILNDYLHTEYSFDQMIYHEEYLCGDYALYDENELNAIRECISNEGMIVDPTYSGKAFYGMVDIIAKSKSFAGQKILFWNTGGLFNLLSEL